MYCHKEELHKHSVSWVFFAFTVYIASNTLSEFCDIHLNFAAVGRHHYIYVGKSMSELQVQVATHVFEFSAGNCRL